METTKTSKTVTIVGVSPFVYVQLNAFVELACPIFGSLKGQFHEPTNHDDERNKTADEWKLTKNNRSV